MKNHNIMWYRHPAKAWEEALPIGNGRIGAMVFGGFAKERIALNDDSIWYGAYRNRINPEAKENLEKVRELIFAGHVKEAEKILKFAFSGIPDCERPYQPLGNLLLAFDGECEEENYYRELDLGQGIASVEAEYLGRTIRKEYFASNPDSIIMIRIQVLKGAGINLDLSLNRERFYEHTGKVNDHMIFMDGRLGDGGFDFCAAVGATSPDGKVYAMGRHVAVENAREITIAVASGSSFYEHDEHDKCYETIEKALSKGYEACKADHIRDFKDLFDRVEFSLKGERDYSMLPTDERLRQVITGTTDVGLEALYFNFGRYLMISGSRPGSQPLNLQGIWNEKMQPNWDSKFTVNINTEMNYWIAESCNLPECHLPLFDLLKRAAVNGQQTAKQMYGCRGFVIHHNTDIYADTAPQDEYIPATYWTMGGAWLCTHLWQHYLYTNDRIWLEQEAYPILREAVLFFVDFLIEKDGVYVTCPSLSPENTYVNSTGERAHICAGPSMDNSILRDLFDIFIKASKLLHKDEVLRDEVQIRRNKLPGLQIGSDGRLLEWDQEYKEVELGHRHISHLYALYPSHQISVDKTPELAKAAAETLKCRMDNGGGYTGWSCAWIISFYARLRDKEHAYGALKKLLTQSTYPNLMDNHPTKDGSVFQIDGNLGACAGMLEMLIQTDELGTITQFPALPVQWKSGKIKGLKLPGGKTINISW